MGHLLPMVSFIQVLKKNETLGPFLGSGTTLVTAVRLGMKRIGIDDDAECVEISQD